MYFYKHFYVLSFILHYHMTTSIKNLNLRYKSGLESVIPCSVGLQFFTEINNTSSDDYSIELNPDMCCLELPDGEDCNVMEIEGCTDFIPKGSTKILKLVAPILDPYDRKGYCIVYIDSRPIEGQRTFMRDTLKIPFDTRIKGKHLEDVKKCKEIDEDPQNDCKPVDCDTYYNGKRPFFNSKTKKCTKISRCVNKNDPRVIYDPITNSCIKKKSVGADDIDFIKSLNDGRGRQPKDILIIKNFKYHNKLYANDTKKGEDNDNELNFFNKAVNNPPGKNVTKPVKTKSHSKTKLFNCPNFKYFTSNKYTLTILGIVIIIQCCLICTLFYCMTYKCLCCNKKKKVVRQFFNYKQDASVTTPLIYTSNIETDTTEFPYLSESSVNVNTKIKCYKACQKERLDDVKISLSDDILSKCLNRRDWERKPNSETIQIDINERVNMTEIKNTESKKISDYDRKYTNANVNYENEKVIDDKSKKVVAPIINKVEKEYSDNTKSVFSGVQCDLSEKEIRCHSYNYMGASTRGSNVTGFKPSVHKTFDMYKTDRSKKGTISVSSDKGAQACFSNDSIDDFLSERGMIFLADNGSKYTFSSTSQDKSSSNSVSSRTSKKNIVKNIFSIFSRKSKHGPISDPGLKTSKDNLDLQLLHMSHASVYSSSNNGSDFVKGFKRVKDSRTSL